MSEASETFYSLASEVMHTLDEFQTNIEYVNQNTQEILNQTINVTNEVSISNGKIDHINLKLSGYKVALSGEKETITDQHSCRFGKWFTSEVISMLGNDQFTIGEISKHHENVHQGLNRMIDIFSTNKNNPEGLRILKDVESSSKKGFETLLQAIKKNRK
jgi:hypothetical protein